ARINACRNDQSNPSCRTIIANLCHRDNNPFDSLCGSNYNLNRERACYSNPNSSRCRDTLTRVCGGNPFDSLCRNTQSYLDTRVSICRGNPNDGRCGRTIRAVCGVDPFDRMCNSFYDYRRETACRNGGANTQCGGIISGVCGDNPFDSLCGSGYTNARETACRNGSASTGQCGNIVAGICSGNPFDPLCGSGYTQNRRSLCLGDPFATRCAGEGYNDLRVTFCENNAGTHPSCPAPEPTITEPTIAEGATPQVTASVWADSFALPLAHGATAADRRNKFLIGRATNLDTGGLTPYRRNSGLYTDNRNLNLADATFNGQSLGGDRADGVAFFATGLYTDNTYRVYAGILEGTNLGAPLTDTAGSAKWLGSFKVANYSPQDFILNISFGTGDGAGEIDGIIEGYNRAWDYEIVGEFDDAGVIAGSVSSPIFGSNSDISIYGVFSTYPLTGLIGEEGAVGAFLLAGFHGGFVARPPSGEELQSLEQTCNDNPFDKLCSIGYESQRNAIIEQCIVGDNANNDALCGGAITWDVCVESPFFTNCNYRLPDYYEQAQANRLAFCRTAGNADNALCNIWATVKHICTTYPFDAQCLGDNRFTELRRDACLGNPFATRCAGEGYNDLRVSFC
ncbi:MAG: hypothetical protein K8953_13515, partial [Proteobacteria bacterium]|nr:hypothetical protein [Pseudomonadota bacterium]